MCLSLSSNLVCAKVSESQVLAAVIVQEAGGEGQTGMLAVAGVIQNRAAVRRATPYAIVTKKFQFESYARVLNGKLSEDEWVNLYRNHPRWLYAVELADKIDKKLCPDITHGSTNFHNTSMTPYWAKKMSFQVKIGKHLFYKETS